METLSLANMGFALDLFRHVSQHHNNKNVFFSPWSISSLMAAVYLGAKGCTAEQIAEVFHFKKAARAGSPRTTKPRAYSKMEELLRNPCISIQKAPLDVSNGIHSEFQAVSQEINQPSQNVLLRSINQLYGDKSAPFKDEFLRSVKKYYNIEPQTVDFQNASDEVRKEINSWVEHQTEGKIQNLLNEGSIDACTQLVLVNALYFKGNWSKTFKKEATTEQPFRLNKSTSKAVKMMFQKGKFNWNYINEVRTHILELPYVNHHLSMFILLPEDISDNSTGLEMLERELTSENLSKWTSPEQMEETEVRVYLPRIQVEDSYELKAALTHLGITDAFNAGRSDFSRMSDKNNLSLSQVFHKCFVDINEEGTEAAASSIAEISSRSEGDAVLFAAEHPFLFFIRHNKTKNILFLGKFCSP